MCELFERELHILTKYFEEKKNLDSRISNAK